MSARWTHVELCQILDELGLADKVTVE